MVPELPSWTDLHPGGTLRIPVAFEEALWDGVAKAQNEKGITVIRVFYDQTPWRENTENLWQGYVFSPFYDIGLVLPRRGFKTAKQRKAENAPSQSAHETRYTNAENDFVKRTTD